jgi:hypothetical protein
MKNLILIPMLLWLPMGLGENATAQDSMMNHRNNFQFSGGGGCVNAVTGTTSTSVQFANSSDVNIGSSFVASCSTTVAGATVRLSYPNGNSLDGSFQLQCLIYSDSGGSPGSQIGTGSAGVLANTIGSVEQDVVFTGMSVSLTAGTTYWVVIRPTNFYSPLPAAWYCASKPGAEIYGNSGAWFGEASDVAGKFILN